MPPLSPEDEGLIPSKRFIGVWWEDENDRWLVRVHLDEHDTSDCGYFYDEVQAAHAYDRAVLDLVPGDPKLNFPEEEDRIENPSQS